MEVKRINWDLVISRMIKDMREKKAFCGLQPFVPELEIKFMLQDIEDRSDIWELAIYDKRKFKMVKRLT